MKTILVDAGSCFVIKGQGIYQPMYELLETYPNPKILSTNLPPEKREEYPFSDLPYPLFSLSNQPSKADSTFYEILLKEYNLTTQDVICFEHKHNAEESAKSLGIPCYFYDEHTQDLESLKKFLDENL